MPRRVIIQGGSASPFRVSANDAASDDTFALIFDGNQSPLRLLAHGWIIALRDAGNIAPAVFNQAAGPVYDTSVPGFPLFSCSAFTGAITTGDGVIPNRAKNPFTSQRALGDRPPPLNGFGGALSGGFFYGINYAGGPYNINYMIFRNRG